MTRAYCRRINKDRRQVPLSSFDQHGILCTLQCRFLAVLQFSICLSVRSFLNILAVCSRTSILEELGIQVFSPCSILLSGDYHNSLIYHQAVTFTISSNIYHSVWTSLYVWHDQFLWSVTFYVFEFTGSIDLCAMSNSITLRLTSILIHSVI